MNEAMASPQSEPELNVRLIRLRDNLTVINNLSDEIKKRVGKLKSGTLLQGKESDPSSERTSDVLGILDDLNASATVSIQSLTISLNNLAACVG